MHKHHMPEDRCPRCGARATAASNARPGDRRAPVPGDLTVCIACAGLLQFDDSLRLVPLPEDALSGLEADTREVLLASRNAVRVVLADRAMMRSPTRSDR